MRLTFRNSLFACALLSAPFSVVAQEQPAPQPATPPAQQAPAAPTAVQQAAGAPERDLLSLGVFGWLGPSKLRLRTGTEFFSTRAGNIDLHDRKNRPVYGAVLTVPIKEHHLRFSYFEASNSGNTTPAEDLNIFAGDYDKGTYLSTRYKVQNGKISFDYLSWPYPFAGRKFRLHTLWEVQYTNIKGSFDAPLKPVGEFESNAVESNKFFIYPSLGLGAEYKVSKNFRFEASGTGFYLPHRPNLWDAHAAAIMRLGKVELTVGGKGFHFQMSRKTENYYRGTLAGAYVGLAWRFE